MSRRPTLREVTKAKPRPGAGAPSRTKSHYSAILQLLKDRGEQGVLSSELYGRPELFGRSPRNRISELRKHGHLIEGKPHGASDWFYRLIRDNAGSKPGESEYMKRVRAENAAACPLFFEESNR
jgi:hypothetical protein